MCGLFGFLSRNGARPDADLLLRAALLAGKRGPHAFGVARLIDGHLSVSKRAGQIKDYAASLRVALDVPMQACIGQTRLATSGSYRDNKNNQPLLFDDSLVLAHNGNVYNWRELAEAQHLDLETACDSEVIGALLLREQGPLVERIQSVVRQIDARSPLAMLVLSGDELVAVRRDLHPLYASGQEQSVVLCSRPLDGNAMLLPDHAISVWRASGAWEVIAL